MKAGIFDPYLDTLGGGERYTMTVAECLTKSGWLVDVFWDDETLKPKLAKRFGLSLKKVKFVRNIFASKRIFEKLRQAYQYDLLFYLSDGSAPFLFGRKNILHFQVPFQNVDGKKFLNRLKFKKIGKVVCNSQFTKQFIDQEYGVKSIVVYPPIDIANFHPGQKEKIILSVSRFSKTLHAKKQEVLIDVFKKLSTGELKEWRLILAGGLRREDRGYFEELARRAKDLPVEFLTNVTFPQLKKLYGQATIFWHAAGFDEDEQRHPERMEHFGIVVVEAMAAGCVPIVIGKGGIPEIIEHGKNGFLWQEKKELANLTLQLIKSPEMMKKVSIQAIKSSKRFSKKDFCQKIHELVKD